MRNCSSNNHLTRAVVCSYSVRRRSVWSSASLGAWPRGKRGSAGTVAAVLGQTWCSLRRDAWGLAARPGAAGALPALVNLDRPSIRSGKWKELLCCFPDMTLISKRCHSFKDKSLTFLKCFKSHTHRYKLLIYFNTNSLPPLHTRGIN